MSAGEFPLQTLADVERAAIRLLKQQGVDTPELDARLLLEDVTGLSRAALLVNALSPFPPAQAETYAALLRRRCQREPVARLLGWREFWGLRFSLSPATLEPRPDSETLIEAVLAHRPDRTLPYRIADFGTGTGCLLAVLLHEYPQATGVAVDRSEDALHTAHENFTALSLMDRVSLVCTHWADGLTGQFDLILSNPPYIPSDTPLEPEVAHHDPALALFAGHDGLEAYRTLLPHIHRLLSPDGLAVIEVGAGQASDVTRLAQTAGLDVLTLRPDLADIPRAAVLSRAKP